MIDSDSHLTTQPNLREAAVVLLRRVSAARETGGDVAVFVRFEEAAEDVVRHVPNEICEFLVVCHAGFDSWVAFCENTPYLPYEKMDNKELKPLTWRC